VRWNEAFADGIILEEVALFAAGARKREENRSGTDDVFEPLGSDKLGWREKCLQAQVRNHEEGENRANALYDIFNKCSTGGNTQDQDRTEECGPPLQRCYKILGTAKS